MSVDLIGTRGKLIANSAELEERVLRMGRRKTQGRREIVTNCSLTQFCVVSATMLKGMDGSDEVFSGKGRCTLTASRRFR
jgi:hypothetical protein